MKYYRIPGEKGGPDTFRKVSTAKDAPPVEEMGLPENAEEVPRFPREFERWEGGKFVKDADAESEHSENARLRRMSPKARHDEAIQQAVTMLRAELNLAPDLKAKGSSNG